MSKVYFRKRAIMFRGRPTGQLVNDVYLDGGIHTAAVGESQLWRVMKAVAAYHGAQVIGTEQ